MHTSPSKNHSCSVQTVGLGEAMRVGDSEEDSIVIIGFWVGQVGEVPHDGLIVGVEGVDSVVIDGSVVDSRVVGVGVTGSGVVCSTGEGFGDDSVVIVGFGVGQVGEVPHDGLIVGDEGVDSFVIDGSGVESGVVGVGVTGSGVVGTTMLGSAVVGLVAVGSYVVSSGTGVGDSGEGPGVAMHTSQYMHSPLSNWAYSQHSVRVSKYVISSGLRRISGLSYPFVHCFKSLKTIMYHLRPSQGVGAGLGNALILVSSVGIGLGFSVGAFVGLGEGPFVSFNVGSSVGEGVGSSVGTGLYTSVCASVGLGDRSLLVFRVGSSDGEGVMGKFEGESVVISAVG